MKDLKSMLRDMILEELNEGRRERDWIAQQPEELQQAYSDGERQGLKIPHLAWIKKVRGEEPVEDIISDVVEFLDDSSQQKLSDNGFETQLSAKTYPSVNDLRILMKKIEDAEESDIQYDNILKDPSQVQLIGKVGKWEVLMPVTQRGSIACDISGRDTTWCTQKRAGQNLFYSYVARHGQDIILFYVMDYTRTPDLQAGKDEDARLSIGFIDGKPILDGRGGYVSVNAINDGLTEQYLQSALGENYNEIMSLMTSKAEEVGGKHPAKEQMKKAATNLFYLKKLVKDLGEKEKQDFLKQIALQKKLSFPVYSFLVGKTSNAEFDLFYNPKKHRDIFDALSPNQILTVASKSNNEQLISIMLKFRTDIPEQTFLILVKRNNSRFDRAIAEMLKFRTDISEQTLLMLAKRNNSTFDRAIADLPTKVTIPPEAMMTILKNSEGYNNEFFMINFVERSGGRGASLSPEVMEYVVDSGNIVAIERMLTLPNGAQRQKMIPASVIDKIIKKAEEKRKLLPLIAGINNLSEEHVRLITNSAVNMKLGELKFGRATQQKVFKKLIRNTSTPSDVLEIAYTEGRDDYELNNTIAIADHSKASPNLLLKIAKDVMPQKVSLDFIDAEWVVIDRVVGNENTPSEALEHILINDEAGEFTDAIQKHPNYKGNLEESKVKISKSELRQIILEEVLKMMK